MNLLRMYYPLTSKFIKLMTLLISIVSEYCIDSIVSKKKQVNRIELRRKIK